MQLNQHLSALSCFIGCIHFCDEAKSSAVVLPPLSFSLPTLSQDSPRDRQDVYGDTHWWTYGQVQVLRWYGHRWQDGHLACRIIGTAKDKGSAKKILGWCKTSVRLIFLPSYSRIGHKCMKELEFPQISVYLYNTSLVPLWTGCAWI